MKKRTHKTLYPEKESITWMNFILENQQLTVLIILIVFITIFIVGCIFCIDFFRSEHVYNTGIGVIL